MPETIPPEDAVPVKGEYTIVHSPDGLEITGVFRLTFPGALIKEFDFQVTNFRKPEMRVTLLRNGSVFFEREIIKDGREELGRPWKWDAKRYLFFTFCNNLFVLLGLADRCPLQPALSIEQMKDFFSV